MRKLINFLLICAVVFSMSFGQNVRALGKTDYVLGNDSGRISIPQTHRVIKLLRNMGEKGGMLSEPTDIFVDANDNIYVCDTGNNRVVKLDSNGNFLKSFTSDNSFSSPSGVYVSKTGDIYIADTLNERIVHLDENGEYVEKFVKPDSEMISEDSTFQVSRIGITTQGYIYTMQGQYFMMIDANNDFKGYVGDNQLGFSLKRLLIRTFASKEQQEKLIKEDPTSYYSFDIGSDGLIYATTGEDSSANQIQKINMVGDNIFPKKFYGEKYYNKETNRFCNPRFVDITVDENGIIYVIEAYTRNIYVYDKEANMLGVFGGLGNIKGKFSQPVAIDTLSNGNLLVLDQTTGFIHIFERTDFMNNITKAVEFFDQGRYDEAKTAWESVLDFDANYPVANKGIGDSLYKQGKIEEAMKYYKLSENKSGYGGAFSEFQYRYFRKNFVLVVLAATLIITGSILLISYLKKRSDKVVDDYYSGGRKGE